MIKTSLVALATTVALGLATPAMAQESIRTNGSYDREFSFNYSFLREDGLNASAGMMIDVGKQIGSHVSVVGEFALNHFAYWEESYVQGAGGLRFGNVKGRTRLFAQVLTGLQRSFGESGFVIQPGLGANVAMGRAADLRVQMDFPLVRWEGDNYQQYRFSVGLGLALGGR